MHGPQEGLLELTDVTQELSNRKIELPPAVSQAVDVEKEKGKFFIATLKYATGFPCFCSPCHPLMHCSSLVFYH